MHDHPYDDVHSFVAKSPAPKPLLVPPSPHSRVRLFAVVALVLALAPMAKAQTTYTWNDSTTDWLTASGWTTSGPDWTSTSQLTDAIAAFASESAISNQPTIGSSTIYASKITFDNAGSAWNVSGSGTINVGSGGIVFDATSTSKFSTIAPTIALNRNQTWDIGSNNVVSASGVVSGSNGLTKAGGGTLTLSGTNTYSGGTMLNAGTLVVRSDSNLGAVPSSAATNITFDGGTLQPESLSRLTLNANRSITLNVGGGTVNTGLSYFTSSDITIAGAIGGSGGLAITGIGTAVLSGINTYGGGTTISGFNTLQISSDANLGTVPSTPTTNLTFDRGRLQLGSAFNLGSNRSMVLNSGGGEIDTNGYDSTYGGVISGSGALRKYGTGTLTLTGTSTYSGGTRISGTLEVSSLADGGAASSLGASGSDAANLELAGGTLRYTGPGGSTDRLFRLSIFGDTIDASGSGAIRFTNAGAMGFSNGGTRTLTLSGTNTGANTLAAAIGDNFGATSLIKSGAGTWVLSGTNTYTGPTTINAGTLRVSIESNLGATPSAAAENVIFGSGTLQFGASFNPSSNRSMTLNSGGGTIDTNGFDCTYGGVISGSGGLTKYGSGTLTLSGTNTYSGGTTINAGTLQIGAGGTTGSIVGNVTNNAALVFNQSNASAYGGVISGTGHLTKAGGGTLTLSGTNTYSGGTMLNAGTLVVRSDSNLGAVPSSAATNITFDGGTLQPESLSRLTLNANRSITLNVGGGTVNTGLSYFTSSDITIAGAIGGSGGLAITGIGTAVLSGINTYGGGTTISGFNTLQISSDANLGTVPSTPTTNLTFDRGRLQLGSAFNLGSNRSMVLNSGGGEIDTNGYDSTYGGVISGSGALRKYGTGTLTLTGTSTYSGGTRISGTLEVSSLADGGAASSLGASGSDAANLELAGGTLRYTGPGGSTDRLFRLSIFGDTIDASGSGAIRFTNAGAMGFINNGTRTLTLSGTNTGANTLAAAIGDNVGATSLIKSGAGTWVLSGNSTYTGPTTINAGTLVASGSLATSAVSVWDGLFDAQGANLLPDTSTLMINGGRYQLGGSDLVAAFTINGGELAGTGNTLTAATYSLNGGTVSANLGAGTYTIGGDVTITGAVAPTGTTTVPNGSTLAVDSSFTGDVSVATGAILGGTGTIMGNVTFGSGAQFTFNASSPLAVSGGSVSFTSPGDFGVDDIVGLSSLTPIGTYTLIAGTVDTSNLANFGLSNAYDLGGGKSAYFQQGSLQVTVVPEPSSLMVMGLMGVVGASMLRRRQHR